MCLITYLPHKGHLNEDYLRYSNYQNDDGFGIMFAGFDGRVKVIKSMSAKFADLLAAIDEVPANTALAIHQRFRTHGAKDLERCHPFRVFKGDARGKNDLWLMHNGVLDLKGDAKRSDTQEIIEDELRPILKGNVGLLDKDPFQRMLAERIDAGNKFLFMNGAGDVTIINSDSGHEEGEVWYSNTYSLPLYSGGKYTNSRGKFDWDAWDAEQDKKWERAETTVCGVPPKSAASTVAAKSEYMWRQEKDLTAKESLCGVKPNVSYRVTRNADGSQTLTPISGNDHRTVIIPSDEPAEPAHALLDEDEPKRLPDYSKITAEAVAKHLGTDEDDDAVSFGDAWEYDTLGLMTLEEITDQCINDPMGAAEFINEHWGYRASSKRRSA